MRQTLRHHLVAVSWLCAGALSCGGDRGQPISDADLSVPDAPLSVDAQTSDAAPGVICVNIGEMGFPSACTANGRAWARVCTAPCTPNAQCQWYSLCDYIAGNRACSACIDGFADGNYFVGGFIDTDGNADPNNPAPDPGDISAASCDAVSVTNGGTASASVTTQQCP